jgi:hypothetical protein
MKRRIKEMKHVLKWANAEKERTSDLAQPNVRFAYEAYSNALGELTSRIEDRADDLEALMKTLQEAVMGETSHVVVLKAFDQAMKICSDFQKAKDLCDKRAEGVKTAMSDYAQSIDGLRERSLNSSVHNTSYHHPRSDSAASVFASHPTQPNVSAYVLASHPTQRNGTVSGSASHPTQATAGAVGDSERARTSTII